MSYTISIKKDGWESLLEIKIQEEILEQDFLVYSHLESCFKRVFQIIKEKSGEKPEVDKENSEHEGDSSE